MRLIFSFLFLVFIFVSVQVKGQVLLEYEVSEDMDLFDWRVFIEEGEIEGQVDFRKRRFDLYGVGPNVLTGLNLSKLDLVQIELELGLYKKGLKLGLSVEEIERAEEAIERHWESIVNIERQIRYHAGLLWDIEEEELDFSSIRMAGSVEDYQKGVWELYKGDQETLLNMLDKKYEDVYKELGEDDELYAELILSPVEGYMRKIEDLSTAYYDSWISDYELGLEVNRSEVYNLFELYKDNLAVYRCYLKNFREPEGEIYQEELMGSIEGWYDNQSALGADNYIESYKYGMTTDPASTVYDLHRFGLAPLGVRERIAKFYREDVLNNPEFIDTDDTYRLGARVDALIGLRYLRLLEPEEQELFDRAFEEGVIRRSSRGYFGYGRPLP